MRILLPVLLLALFSSCSLQKRLYRPGFTFFPHGKVATKSDKNPVQVESFQLSAGKTGNINDARTILVKQLSIDTEFSGNARRNTYTNFQRSVPVLPATTTFNKSEAPYMMVGSNSVPKAGFRTFIYSLVLFSGALYCFFNLTGLVYVTAGLLIMAFVFCLVSLLTSVSARKDKINNSKGWLVMSLITLLLDILEIAAIAIFFIALF
jgi:hypothetical protein